MKKKLSFVVVIVSMILAGMLIGCQNQEAAKTAAEESVLPESSVQEDAAEESSAQEASEAAAEEKEESSQAEMSEESSEATEASEEIKEDVPSVIGTDTGSETQAVIEVTNGLPVAITSILFGEPFGEYMGANLLPEGTVLAPGETKTMYFDPQAANGAVDYNVYLVFEDGATATLHSFAYDNMNAVTVKDSGSVIYIEYVSLASGEQKSSEMSEYIIKYGGSGGGDGDQGADPNAGCIDDAPTN
ncbi:MAG: hypothetical protein IJM83_09370 [Firmicutes bacterium]|nr:hypothetical protein [Bacillota bacterium]